MLYNIGLILVIGTSTLFVIFSLMGQTIDYWVLIPFAVGLLLCVVSRIKNSSRKPTKGEN